jgi:hypothetical protein
LAQLGVIDTVLAAGITHLPHRKYRGAEVVAEVDPGSRSGADPDVPYPIGLVPQSRVEQILRHRLADLGRTVEFGAELRGFTQHGTGTLAVHRAPSVTGARNWVRIRSITGQPAQ